MTIATFFWRFVQTGDDWIFSDQVVDVVVATCDDGVARAIARAAGPIGGRVRDAVHVIALVGNDEVQVPDVPARQVGAELVEVVAIGDLVGRAALQVAIPLAAAQRPIAPLELGRAAHVLVGHRRGGAWSCRGRPASGTRGWNSRSASCCRPEVPGAYTLSLASTAGIGHAVGPRVLARIHRLAVGAPGQAGGRERVEQVGLVLDVVVDGGSLRAARLEGRAREARLGVVGSGRSCGCVRAGGVAVPLAVVGDAEVIAAAERRVVRLAGVAGGVVARELVALFHPAH